MVSPHAGLLRRLYIQSYRSRYREIDQILTLQLQVSPGILFLPKGMHEKDFLSAKIENAHIFNS